jgi:hypothetical protein
MRAGARALMQKCANLVARCFGACARALSSSKDALGSLGLVLGAIWLVMQIWQPEIPYRRRAFIPNANGMFAARRVSGGSHDMCLIVAEISITNSGERSFEVVGFRTLARSYSIECKDRTTELALPRVTSPGTLPPLGVKHSLDGCDGPIIADDLASAPARQAADHRTVGPKETVRTIRELVLPVPDARDSAYLRITLRAHLLTSDELVALRKQLSVPADAHPMLCEGSSGVAGVQFERRSEDRTPCHQAFTPGREEGSASIAGVVILPECAVLARTAD